MPFCYSPWTNIDIDPVGNIAPCCKFRMELHDARFNLRDQGLADYLNSDFLAQVRQQFRSGQWPQGCTRCQIEEQHGVPSKRQLDQQRWQEHYELYDLSQPHTITASIAFGNVCNLKCITCHPCASSRWQDEYAKLYGTEIRPTKLDQQHVVSDLLEAAPRLVHLDVTGGEPLLSSTHAQRQLLEHYVSTGQAHNISLHYTTNATVFPDADWWQLWSHFKEIDMQLSLDAVGERFNYIRFPADWYAVSQVVQQYQQQTSANLRISISHTVSAYNVLYLPEFLDWTTSQALPVPWLGRVHNPDYLRPTVWPAQARRYIARHLANSGHTVLQQWASMLETTDDSDLFGRFVTYTQRHDQYRNLNFAQVFPDMASYFHEAETTVSCL